MRIDRSGRIHEREFGRNRLPSGTVPASSSLSTMNAFSSGFAPEEDRRPALSGYPLRIDDVLQAHRYAMQRSEGPFPNFPNRSSSRAMIKSRSLVEPLPCAEALIRFAECLSMHEATSDSEVSVPDRMRSAASSAEVRWAARSSPSVRGCTRRTGNPAPQGRCRETGTSGTSQRSQWPRYGRGFP